MRTYTDRKIKEEMNTAGTIGGWLFFVKIILHTWYNYQTDKDFSFGSGQNPQRFLLFLPVFKDGFSQYKVFRLIVNILYWISIFLIVIFLFLTNTAKTS